MRTPQRLSALHCAQLLLPLIFLTSFSAPSLAAQAVPEDFQLAIGLIKREMYDDAGRSLKRFLRAHPKHERASEAWYRLGTCQLEGGQAEAAADSLKKALADRRFKLRAEARYRLGSTLQGLEQQAAAAKQFASMQREVADDHYLLGAAAYAEGECHRDLGEDKAALACFTRAEAKGGDYAFSAAYQKGFVLLRQNRLRDAQRCFAKLASAHPDHDAIGEIRFFEGEAAFRADAFAIAEKAWTLSARHASDYRDDAISGLAWCRVRADDSSAAIGHFKRVLKEHGDSSLAPAAMLEIGRLQHEGGEHKAAARTLATLLATDKLDAAQRLQALELQGLALLETGETAAAEASFAKAIGASDGTASSARLQFHRGEVFAKNESWQKALAAYEPAAKDADAALRGDALYAQALALHKLTRYAESTKKAQRLLREIPAHRLVPLARFAIAENAFAQQDYKAALIGYAELDSAHPMFAQAQFKAAWSVYLGGNPAGGMDGFRRVFDSENQDDALREESLSMFALCAFEAGKKDKALQAADLYRARHKQGEFLARTERIAARVLKSRGDLEGAAARLAVASKSARGDRSAELELEGADVLFQRGDYAGAKKVYSRYQKRSDRLGARACEGYAWCAFELGDEKVCLEAIRKGKSHAEAGDEVAGLIELEVTVHHRAERWAEAERAALTFLKRFGKHARIPEIGYSLGVAQSRAGKLTEARTTLQTVIGTGKSERPDRCFYELAWVCRKLKDEPAALACFAKVVELSKDAELSGEAKLHLGEAAMAANKHKEARDHFVGITGSFRARGLYRCGFAEIALKKPAQAIAAFEKICAMGPGETLHFEARFMAAEQQMETGQHGRAFAHLQALLKGAPDHERAQRARLYTGECAVREKQAAVAVAYLTEFLRQHSSASDGSAKDRKVEGARAQLWLGRARSDRGEHQKAEDCFVAVTSLSDGELAAEAQFRIGSVREAKGDRNGAVDAYVKLSILYAHEPWVPRALLQAGRCYQKLNEPSKAKKFFGELKKRFPNSNEAKQAGSKSRGV